MWFFLEGLILLILGYLSYGRLVEHIVRPNGRQTPAERLEDGVDYLVLPHWKNMLIQLLNIAGIGPVIGVILGIKFGEIVFFIIPIGNIIAGAVHDFLGGMMSIRNDGANLPSLIRRTLGKGYGLFFSFFMALLLLLVVAVFINVPANLFCSLTGNKGLFWIAVCLIFLYYIAATLFPVDKIIGRFYPIFGGMLLVGTAAIFVALMISSVKDPSLLSESEAFRAGLLKQPIIPCLFVTIACGIISGFHATQSPIIARTMKSERQAKSSFYGMMVVEGAIAMVWAGAGLAIYNRFPNLMSVNANKVLAEITNYFLGSWMGGLTLIAVIILAVTSGDTAMRSLRLSLAETFHLNQIKIVNRLLLCVPLILIISGLLVWSNMSAKSFALLWNYFAWGNQVLAASTLMAALSWLKFARRNWIVAAVPGMFMTFIVLTYILWTSPANGGPVGLGLPMVWAQGIAAVGAVAFAVFAWLRGEKCELSC